MLRVKHHLAIGEFMQNQSIYQQRSQQHRFRQSGFTLLELMVALFVLAIGLLGIAGLQSFSLKNTQISGKQTYAMLYSQEMIDNMRANAGALSVPNDTSPYEFDQTTVPTSNIPQCNSTSAGNVQACNAVDLATFQVDRFYRQLKKNVDDNVEVDVAIADVIGSSNKVVTILITWKESQAKQDPDTKLTSETIETKKYTLSALI